MDRIYKIYLRMNRSNNKLVRRCFHFWLRVVYACDIMPGTQIGPGTRFPHCGLGVIINEDAVIGKNCTIGAGVVIGGKGGNPRVPVLGDNVEVGAHALLIGPITIGSNVIIGAGSVVVHDVPKNAIIAGNPAKIIKYNLKIENEKQND